MRQFQKDWDVQQSVLQTRAHNPALFSAHLNLYLFQQTDWKWNCVIQLLHALCTFRPSIAVSAFPWLFNLLVILFVLPSDYAKAYKLRPLLIGSWISPTLFRSAFYTIIIYKMVINARFCTSVSECEVKYHSVYPFFHINDICKRKMGGFELSTTRMWRPVFLNLLYAVFLALMIAVWRNMQDCT